MKKNEIKKAETPRIVFFGTPEFATIILDELKADGLIPQVIVTNPDRPKGRGLTLTPPPAKVWADQLQDQLQEENRGIAVLQPTSLKDPAFIADLKNKYADGDNSEQWDLFIVAAYGKILPQDIIEMPKHGIINVHPSLLPKYRGPSPVQSAILADDRDTGVSIMLIDGEMDHGPILASEKIPVTETLFWPPTGHELESLLAHAGGKLLAQTIPLWLNGKIKPLPQDHTLATYTKKITKADAEIDLAGDAYKNFLKIRAFEGWPGTYFFDKKNIRTLIKKAAFENGNLRILRVIPEGKKEMDYQEEE